MRPTRLLPIGVCVLTLLAAGPTSAERPLTYAELSKVLKSARYDAAKSTKALKDKRIGVILRATGPQQALTVNPRDAIYFSCGDIPKGQPGGILVGRVTGVEDTPEGNVMLMLDGCTR